jgi:nucleoside-diphosphate-sugar epimerase
MTISNDPISPLRILVTGGAGFVGSAIVRELLLDDSPLDVASVKVFDIKPFDDIIDSRITYIRGDICNLKDITGACADVDIVIHTAAVVDWGTKKPEEVYAANFIGTQHVLQACKENNVGMLLFTSSLDTVITGRPLINIDEDQPYPQKHLNMYCESKCLAEKLVLEENSDRLRTMVLRPSDVWGEGDPYHLPPLITMARKGFYVRIGDGSARNQHVYVRNMAWAHVLAAKALLERNVKVVGQAYFITDGPGANFFTFFDDIVTRAGYKIWPHNLWLPKGFTYALGSMAEYIALMVRPFKYYVPKLSRFAVMYTTTSFTFTAGKAKRDFGFYPKYNHDEAIENTVRYFHKITSAQAT